MSARRRVRRQSSLPGLSTAAIASVPPSGPNPFVAGHGSQPVAAGVPVPVPGVPGCTVTPMPQSVSNPALTPYTFTFTANVTPSTYNHADAPKQEPSTPSAGSTEDPSQSPDPSKKSKKRKLSDSDGENPLGQFYSPSIPMQQKQDSHSRRAPDGHIPRPPNAFILFRSDLVQRKAVPSSLEADHSTISKIIGVCWRTLPPRQRKRWEEKAAEAKALHKKMYPNYRYAPVHRKDKKEKRPKQKSGDEERSLDIAGLLLQGHTGEDLSQRMSSLDALKKRNGVAARQQPQAPKEYTFVQGMPNSQGEHAPLPIQAPIPHLAGPGGFSAYGLMHRRSSSAPPADGIFMHHSGVTPTASTSNVSTPLARASTLAPDSQSPAETAEVPLSRIARNLPRDGKVPKTEGKKTKSTISKSVKAKASGKPGRKRGDDFIQSVWTAHAVADEQRKQQQLLQSTQTQPTPQIQERPAPGVQPAWALNDAPPPPSIAPSPAASVQSFHSEYPHPSQQMYGQQQMDFSHGGFAPFGQQPHMTPNVFDPHTQAQAYGGGFGNYAYSDVSSGYVEPSNPMNVFRNPFDPVSTAGTPPGDSPLSSQGFEYYQEQPFQLGLGGEHGIQGTWSTPGPNPTGMAMDMSGYTDPSMVDPLQPLPSTSQPIPTLQVRYGGSEGSGADSSNPHSPASNEGIYPPVLPHSQVPPLQVPGMHLDTSGLLLSAPQHPHGYDASPTAELTEQISQFHMQDWSMNPMGGMDIHGNPLTAAGPMDISCSSEWTEWTNPNPFGAVDSGNRVVGVPPEASNSAMGLPGYGVDPLVPSSQPPEQDTGMTFVT